MSAGQIIQIAATAVGAFFGGPAGAMAGSMVGGYVGRGMDAQDRTVTADGPRLSDYKIQTAQYGVDMARVYGSAPIAGNLIWSSDLIETITTSSSTQSQGKGGGGDSVTTTTTSYSYSVNVAIGLCGGPISGIGKIWANGKLIFDGSSHADAQTALASQTRADAVRVYLGDDSQTADPLIEAAEGAGNVPGFRDTAYLVLEDFQLAEFGNQMPQFEVEVISAAGAEELPGIMSTIPTTTGAQTMEYDQGTYTVTTIASGATTDVTINTYDIDGNLLTTKTVSRRIAASNIIPRGNWRSLMLESYGSTPSWWNVETDDTGDAAWLTGLAIAPFVLYRGVDYGFILYKITATNEVKLAKLPINPAIEANVGTMRAGPTVPYNYPELTLTLWVNAGADDRLYFDGTWVWVADSQNGILYRYTQNLELSDQWTYALPGGGAHGFIYVFDDRFVLAPASGGAGARIFQLNADGTSTALVSASWDSGEVQIPYPITPGALIGLTKVVSVYSLLTPGAQGLDEIVAAECALAGLDAGDIDVTDLAATSVRGYIARRAPLRSILEQLSATFFYDAVESDGQIKFVMRGNASAVTIPAAELAAHIVGEEMPDPVAHEHGMDVSLPSEISLSFLNASAQYEQGEQYARRQATNALGEVSIEIPIVLTDDEAVQVANAALFDAWAARDAFTFQTSRKYGKYEPGDVMTLPFPSADTTDVLITKRDDGANGVIRWSGRFTEGAVYTQTMTTQAAPEHVDTITLPGPTLFKALDIPLLRDVDDAFGFYGAVLGYLDGWHGAQVYASKDGGGSYQSAGALFTTEATIGYAETALGVPVHFDQFDDASSVDVRLAEGTLSSVTRDQLLEDRELNLAAIGEELVQFKTATLLAAQRYRLTGLLRGRLGTDRAAADHAAGEDFVLIDRDSTRFILAGAADVDAERKVKAVSIGNTLAGSAPIDCTYTGANLKPLSVAHLRGGRDATGNLNIDWIRRTRLNATWRDYVDAPLGEVSERYSIDVLDSDGEVVRTLSATTSTKQYTAAQQTTDFGAPQASIVVEVYQISERIGRGYVATATL